MDKPIPVAVGSVVHLRPADGAVIPCGGPYTVSKVNEDGSFHVGGNTAVWPERIWRVA